MQATGQQLICYILECVRVIILKHLVLWMYVALLRKKTLIFLSKCRFQNIMIEKLKKRERERERERESKHFFTSVVIGVAYGLGFVQIEFLGSCNKKLSETN